MAVYIDDYAIDAAIVETHRLPSLVTDDPVEKGAPTTDQIIELPDEITLECVVSNSPIGDMVDERAAEATDNTPEVEAYNRLLAIRKRGEPVRLITSLGIHHQMALMDLSIPRRCEGGDSLRFTATFKKVNVVENERTTVLVAVPNAEKRVNRGNKPNKTPPETPPSETASKKSSILYKIIH